MQSFQIKFRINEVQRNLRYATDSQEIAQLEKDLKEWKRHLHDAELRQNAAKRDGLSDRRGCREDFGGMYVESL